MPNLLRLIDRHTDLDFVRTKRKDFQSDTGRPSIDPELLLRILLVGYLYGITSERKVVERVAYAPEMWTGSQVRVGDQWLNASEQAVSRFGRSARKAVCGVPPGTMYVTSASATLAVSF